MAHDTTTTGLVCDLSALADDQRRRSRELLGALRTAVVERRELPDGIAMRYDAGQLVRLAEWVDLERRCCPFFHFRIEVAGAGGPVWLTLTGPPGVKAFLAS